MSPEKPLHRERSAAKENFRAAEGDLTRDAILDAAEELFAQFGAGAVSIRSVNAAAGLAPAGVHYHFGNKDALTIAVLRRRGDQVTRRHFELLDALEHKDRPTTVDLVTVMSQPLLEVLEVDPVRGLRWLKIVARMAQDRDELLLRQTMRRNGVNERFEQAVTRTFPKIPREEILLRWRIASNALLRLLANADAPMAHDIHSNESGISKSYVETLIAFTIDGLEGVNRGL
jgi:AcrR family transcriptional regulator